MVALRSKKYLRFVLQTLERVTVNNSVPIPLEIGTKIAASLLSLPSQSRRRFGSVGRKKECLSLVQHFANAYVLGCILLLHTLSPIFPLHYIYEVFFAFPFFWSNFFIFLLAFTQKKKENALAFFLFPLLVLVLHFHCVFKRLIFLLLFRALTALFFQKIYI